MGGADKMRRFFVSPLKNRWNVLSCRISDKKKSSSKISPISLLHQAGFCVCCCKPQSIVSTISEHIALFCHIEMKRKTQRYTNKNGLRIIQIMMVEMMNEQNSSYRPSCVMRDDDHGQSLSPAENGCSFIKFWHLCIKLQRNVAFLMPHKSQEHHEIQPMPLTFGINKFR